MTTNDDNEEVKLTKGQLKLILDYIEVDAIPKDRIYHFLEKTEEHSRSVWNWFVNLTGISENSLIYTIFFVPIIISLATLVLKIMDPGKFKDIIKQEDFILIYYSSVLFPVMIIPAFKAFWQTENKKGLFWDIAGKIVKLLSISIYVGILYAALSKEMTSIFFAFINNTYLNKDISNFAGYTIISIFMILSCIGMFFSGIKLITSELSLTHKKWKILSYKAYIPNFLYMVLLPFLLHIGFVVEKNAELQVSRSNSANIVSVIGIVGTMAFIYLLNNKYVSQKYNEKYANLIVLKQSLEIGANTETAPVKANIISNLYSKMGLFMANIKQKLGVGAGDSSEKDLASSVKEGSQNPELSYRKAKVDDLPKIVELLIQDELGKTREVASQELDPRYVEAFKRIDSDQNQYLMIALKGEEIVGTCHLTIMPSLTFSGSTRMQIEAVRVAQEYRGQKIGEWMMKSAIEYAKNNQVSIVQLTTHKQRERSKKFYERLGFEASHEGMKMRV